jgi:hypothetical protein
MEHKRTLTTPGMTPIMLNFLRGMEDQLLRPLEQVKKCKYTQNSSIKAYVGFIICTAISMAM